VGGGRIEAKDLGLDDQGRGDVSGLGLIVLFQAVLHGPVAHP